MPELITHYLVGEQIVSKIKDKQIKEVLETNKNEFLLGCQGGDLFFFYNYGLFKDKKSIPSFGDRLHVEKVEEFFEEGLKYIKSHPSNALFAYFAGYLCHYAADKEVHPFVYKKSENTTTMHHNIEFMLGRQYLKDTQGVEAKNFDMDAPFNFTLSDDILDFYITIAKSLYNQALSKNDIKKAKEDFHKFKVITQHPNAYYKVLSKLAKHVVKFDPMALVYKDKNDWEYFTQVEYADFVANIVNAIKTSIEMIDSAYGFAIKDKSIKKYLTFFDGTDFCGRKKQA